jgi:hypothetical protein
MLRIHLRNLGKLIIPFALSLSKRIYEPKTKFFALQMGFDRLSQNGRAQRALRHISTAHLLEPS